MTGLTAERKVRRAARAALDRRATDVLVLEYYSLERLWGDAPAVSLDGS